MRGFTRVTSRVLGLAIVGVLAMAGTASAAAPKFHSTSSRINSNGSLTVAFDERGLGNANVTYALTTDAAATYACINGGGKNPSAANKRTVSQQLTAGGTFQVKNGRVVASLTTPVPSAGSFTCPSGQRLVLAGVSYTNIVLTDTTNSVTTTAPNVSRTFFAV